VEQTKSSLGILCKHETNSYNNTVWVLQLFFLITLEKILTVATFNATW